ncbi:acyltransferase family protein [Methanobrevibacter arboriphilus]|uniref:acyltransferase family protein n=1 Tax=Methanobrevibacter arboriphilus TaxID=39441 RepID=UPI0009EC0D4B|nr:acyltransferase family protein [Methanobrevibacter arboriphilus]
MRKYYMDNLRWIVILLLFPYHTLLIYSGIGSYYFHVANNIFADTFILIFAPPWFMQLLFVIAGIATFYSLKKRNITQYLKERVSKLLIPLIAGMILVIPFSVYFVFLFYGYTGNFIDLWISIFTNPDHIVGIFTTSNHTAIGWSLPIGPLWFLLYLFIVSLLALPLILNHDKQNYIIKNLPFLNFY